MQMDIMELDRKELMDLEDIVIDTTQTVENRKISFVKQTHNPYAQNVGKYILRIGYKEDTIESLDDRMILLMKRMARIRI